MKTPRQKVSGRSIIELLIVLFLFFAGIGAGVLLAKFFGLPKLLMSVAGVIAVFAIFFGLQAISQKLAPVFPPCPHCKEAELQGELDSTGKPSWRCRHCGRSFSIERKNHTCYFVDHDNHGMVFYERKWFSGWKEKPGAMSRETARKN